MHYASRETVSLLIVVLVECSSFAKGTATGNSEMTVKATFDVISYLEWTHVNVIYESYYSDVMSDLSLKLNDDMIFASYREFKGKENIMLDQRSDALPQDYVILCMNLRNLFKDYTPDIYSAGDTWVVMQHPNQIIEESSLKKIQGEVIIVNTTGNKVQMFRRRNRKDCKHEMKEWTVGSPPNELKEKKLGQKLSNVHLRVGFGENPPYFILSRDKNGKIKVSGYLGEMIKILSERMNFSYDCIIQKHYGKYENGTWTGIIGDIAKKEIDIQPGVILGKTYWKLLAYTCTVGQIKRIILARKPAMQYSAVFSISRTTNIVLLVFSLWLAAAIVLMLSHKYMHTPSEEFVKTSIPLALFRIWGLLVNANSNISSNSYSSRVTVFTVSLLALIVVGCYSSDITSVSVAGSTSLPFHNLEELLKRTDYKIGLARNTPYLQMLLAIPSGNSRIIGDKIRKDPSVLVSSNYEGVQRAYKEKYCYIGEESVIRSILGNNCSFFTIFMDRTILPLYVAVTRGSIYKQHITWHLQKMKESGIMNYLHSKYIRSKSSDCSADSTEWQPISFTHLLFSFIILSSGIVLSLIMACFERKIRRRKTLRTKCTVKHIMIRSM